MVSLLILINTGLLVAILVLLFVFVWRLRHRLRRLERRSTDLISWVQLDRVLEPVLPLPRPGGWAASTDFLVELVRLIHQTKPALVVELGSGLSTLVIALELRRLGAGRVISIDHEARFASQTEERLGEHGLEGIASVRAAPLKPHSSGASSRQWYDLGRLSDLSEIDILVVDGPPAEIDPAIREQALHYFWNRISLGGLVVFDDAARKGEARFLKKWALTHPGANLSIIEAEKGMAVIVKSAA